MEILKIKAPAKINIGLNVIGKRDDGFHNIETIFYPIDLYDVLTFEKSKTLTFTSNSEILNEEGNNLVLRALLELEKKTEKEFKLKIQLEKNIPIGAGLGGGSSDAAAVLKLIRKIYSLRLSDKELIEAAASIGSDVPFFLSSDPSFASSKGEVLQKVNLKINKPILIINPEIHIPTKWAYENTKPKTPKFNLVELINRNLDFKSLKGKVTNDFEKIVFNKFPEIMHIKDKLYKLGAEFALMTGSGSTLFGIFQDLEKAEMAKESFLKYFTFVHYEK